MKETLSITGERLGLRQGQYAELTVTYKFNDKGEKIITHRQVTAFSPIRELIYSTDYDKLSKRLKIMDGLKAKTFCEKHNINM